MFMETVGAIDSSIQESASTGGNATECESRSAPEAEFSDAERAAVKKFFAALCARCESVSEEDNCLCCDMRLFCYAAPPSKTDDMLDDVMNFLQDRKLAAEIMAQMDKQDHFHTGITPPAEFE